MAKAKAEVPKKLTEGTLRQPALGPHEHELLSELRATFISSVTNKTCPDCEGLKLYSGKFCPRCKGLGRVRA